MRKLFILFLLTQLAFSQSKALPLEEKIYVAIDKLVANPNEESLRKLESFERSISNALDVTKNKTELLAFVILNCNKAYYQNQFGQIQKAIKSYEKAWQLFQKNKLSNYDITESCLKPLGNLYTIIGDYENAENVIKQYYFIANLENNQQQKFASILNLSNVYQYSGKHLDAVNLLEKTIASEKLSNTQKGMLCNNLGNNYLASNNNKKAASYYKISITLLKKSNENESLSNAYRNLALLNNDLQLFEQAKETFLKNNNNSSRAIAKLYYDEAFLYFQNDQIIESQNAVNRVFTTLIPSYSSSKSLLPKRNLLYAETTLLDAFDLQAKLFLAQSQPKKALESYALSFHIEELFQLLLVYENSKIITQIRNRNRTEKCIEIYNSLYQREKTRAKGELSEAKISYLESAFLLSEKTKSAVLKQSFFDKKNFSREEKLITEQLQNWNTIIKKEQQKSNRADISIINEAIKKQNELMLLLKSERNKKAKTYEKEIKIEDLLSKLEKENAILVEYFMGNENVYIFTIENNSIKLNSIKTDSTNSKIVSFLDYFSDSEKIANSISKYNTANFSLYQTLQLPKKSNNKNLIIIPDGLLTFLPFEALITKESKTTNFAKMSYLLYDFKIGYSNSADFYLNSIPFYHKKETILGVFPLFENSNLELAFSKNELKNLQANFSGKYLDKQEASFENFKKNAENYSIIHLSTHASSGDIIEPASIRFIDQEILYSELYNLNLNPNLVVLSACETGIGKLYKSEGAMSVARGFQFAGAQNLLFSLWKVNDFTTSVLMEKFYKKVKKGNSFFESNHQAKLDFLNDETISNAKKSPYYWASFVYYGSLENQSANNNFLWISIIGCVVVFALVSLFLFIRRRRKQINYEKVPRDS